MKRSLPIICLGLLLALCASCSAKQMRQQTAAQKAAMREARALFAASAQPSPEMQAQWGMSTFRVFGRAAQPLDSMAAGAVTARMVTESPAEVEVIVPVWVSGKDLAGEPLRLSRKLYLTMTQGDDKADWQLRGYRVGDDRPLTFWRQLRTWLLWVWLGPLLVFGFLWMIGGYNPSLFNLAFVIAGLLTLPIVGHVSWVCFGTALAVVVGLVVYGILVALLRGLLLAWQAQRLASR